jgi:hypothetical protein
MAIQFVKDNFVLLALFTELLKVIPISTCPLYRPNHQDHYCPPVSWSEQLLNQETKIIVLCLFLYPCIDFKLSILFGGHCWSSTHLIMDCKMGRNYYCRYQYYLISFLPETSNRPLAISYSISLDLHSLCWTSFDIRQFIIF